VLAVLEEVAAVPFVPEVPASHPSPLSLNARGKSEVAEAGVGGAVDTGVDLEKSVTSTKEEREGQLAEVERLKEQVARLQKLVSSTGPDDSGGEDDTPTVTAAATGAAGVISDSSTDA
jgi:hypothetical protein